MTCEASTSRSSRGLRTTLKRAVLVVCAPKVEPICEATPAIAGVGEQHLVDLMLQAHHLLAARYPASPRICR